MNILICPAVATTNTDHRPPPPNYPPPCPDVFTPQLHSQPQLIYVRKQALRCRSLALQPLRSVPETPQFGGSELTCGKVGFVSPPYSTPQLHDLPTSSDSIRFARFKRLSHRIGRDLARRCASPAPTTRGPGRPKSTTATDCGLFEITLDCDGTTKRSK